MMSAVIHVVCGPPAGGKNTFVTEHRKPDDVVVDQDTLNWALGGEHRSASKSQRAAGYAARTAALVKILVDGVEDDSWIIHGKPSESQIESYGRAGAVFHVCAPPMSEVLERVGEDGRDPHVTRELIEAWYENPPVIPEAWLNQQRPEIKGNTMVTKHAHALIKADDNTTALEEGQFVAYASTFTRTPDAYGDIVAKGAFEKSLKEWEESGNVLPVLFGHRMDDPDYNIGAVLKAVEDEHGLKVYGQLDLDSPKGAQVYRLIKGRRLSQLSFAFDVVDAGTVTLEDGTKATELRELKLYEVSLVPIGANQETEVLAVKEAVQVVAQSVKAGRILSAKNEATLRDAVETLATTSASLQDLLSQVVGGEKDSEVASGNPSAPPPDEVKEPAVSPSASVLSALIDIALA